MNFNPIRDRVPIDGFDRRTGDDEDGDEVTGEDLVVAEESLASRLTPDTAWQWLALFVGVALLGTAVNYLWPVVPPIFKSTTAGVVLLFVGTHVANHLLTRHSMLTYWDQFDQLVEFRGGSAIVTTGEVVDRAGNDPLVKRLQSVGFAGLSPSFETVDDVTRSENALAAKLDRRNADGSWGPARIKLDYAYLGRGEHAFLGDWWVVHSGGREDTEAAPGWEARTRPPDTPDMDAARRLMKRDENLRNDVIPALFNRLKTREDQKAWLQSAVTEENLFTMEELQSLLREAQSTQQTATGGAAGGAAGEVPPKPQPGGNGHHPNQAVREADQRAAEQMEDDE